MIQRLIANWKTTSAGIGMIIVTIIHVYFNRPITESVLTTGVWGILGGIGLLFAGDAAVSAIAADKNAVAIDKINALGSDPGAEVLSVTPKPLEPPAETRPITAAATATPPAETKPGQKENI